MISVDLQLIETTLTAIKDAIMNDPLHLQYSNEISVFSKNVLTSQKFLSSIEKDAEAIMADGQITISDLPRMIMILLKSETFIVSLKGTLTNTQFKAVPMNVILKYSSMALFYYFMKCSNADDDGLDSFMCLYPTLWSLVEMSLPAHEEEEESTEPTGQKPNKKVPTSRCCC
jgi:hypothetical protein